MRRLGILVVGLFMLTACGGGDEGERLAAPAATTAPAGSSGPQVTAKLVEVEASVFKFTPKIIVLKLGEPVQFKVTSKDTLHTFSIKDLGISVALNPGESKITEVFTPQQTGTFQITSGYTR